MQGLQKLQVLDRLRTLDICWLHMNSGSASFLNAHLLMIQRSKQKEDCLYFFLCIVLYSIYAFNFYHTKICVSCSSVT